MLLTTLSTRSTQLRGLAMVAALGGLSIAIAAQTPTPPTDGLYSEAQVTRGASLFATYCRACHGPQLTGTEFGPSITGPGFRARWQARSVGELFDVVHTTMPVNSPGNLSLAENAALVAFILERAGFAAGPSDFVPGADARVAVPGATRPNETTEQAGGWYTEAQAARGKALFYRHCGLCHTSGDPTMEKTAAQLDRGWLLGTSRPSMRSMPIKHYPTVYNLYQRIRDSMPGWDIDAATPSEKVDIVAYLLKSNELPTGPTELRLDVEAMKKMPIGAVPLEGIEEGFEPLVEGTRLPGMKYTFGFNCTPAPAGCGRTDDADVVTVENGVLVAEGRYHGLIYTEKKYRDFDLRFDYRWVPPADRDIDDEFYAVSSGYILFIEEPSVWPRGIEVEGNELHIMAAFPLGGEAETTYDTETVERYRKAVGKWNAVQIVSSGGEVKIYLNGGLTTHITQHSYPPGHIGFQYQGGHIEWRRIRIKG